MALLNLKNRKYTFQSLNTPQFNTYMPANTYNIFSAYMMPNFNLNFPVFRTDNIIKLLNEREQPIVFILWGGYARSKKKLITNKNHYIVESVHPSPLSAYNGFFGSRPFSKTNNFLISKNIIPIDWSK